MMSLALLVCRRAFPRRLQGRLHRVASVALTASTAMVLSVAHTAQMADHLHIRNFILRTAPGIWMIFSQCSEICFHMVAAPEVVARTGGAGGFGGNSADWSNFTGGSARGRSTSRKGSDVMADLTISFDEAVFGCEKSISLQDPTTDKVSNLSIHIPAGIESGKTVRLKGQGNPGRNGGAAGDVLLNVNVTPSSEFERKGQNVYSTIRVPFTTAALGGKARVHTLYGDVECSIKAGTQGGSKIRLKGKGISSMKNPSVRGDQYVTVEISVPRRLTPRAKEALEEYRAVS
jgi:molecular chaperone DnaJ